MSCAGLGCTSHGETRVFLSFIFVFVDLNREGEGGFVDTHKNIWNSSLSTGLNMTHLSSTLTPQHALICTLIHVYTCMYNLVLECGGKKPPPQKNKQTKKIKFLQPALLPCWKFHFSKRRTHEVTCLLLSKSCIWSVLSVETLTFCNPLAFCINLPWTATRSSSKSQ